MDPFGLSAEDKTKGTSQSTYANPFVNLLNEIFNNWEIDSNELVVEFSSGKFRVSLGTSIAASTTSNNIFFNVLSAGTTWVVCSNVYSVVESNIVALLTRVDQNKVNEYMEMYQADSQCFTADINTNEDMMAYITMIREVEPTIAENWTEAEMLREFQYHNRTYELLSKLPQTGPVPGLLKRVRHVDFEEDQTIKTYMFRIVGNMMFW